MPSLRSFIKRVINPFCRHGKYKHLRLFMLGRCCKACAISVFVTDRRFLNKESLDLLYKGFLKKWIEQSNEDKNFIKCMFNRMLMTKGFFILLLYVYLLTQLKKVSGMLRNFSMREMSWSRIEQKLMEYPKSALEDLIESPNSSNINDLHVFIFGFNLVIPFPMHSIIPCLRLFTLKDNEVCDDSVAVRRSASTDLFLNMLRAHSEGAQCGNPFFTMAKALVERFCIESEQYLIPLGEGFLSPLLDGDPGSEFTIMSHALVTALKSGFVSSVIELPVLCYCKTKCMRYFDKGALIAIICNSCGYCLNIGKEKLRFPGNFPLNSIFYYRDKQEKTVIYGSHTDIMYCSLCGSQYLTFEKIYEINAEAVFNLNFMTVSWKALIGINSAAIVFDGEIDFDVILPCSARACFSTVCFRGVNINRLLRIISHSCEFYCVSCTERFSETCLDLEDTEYCVGCKIYQSFSCNRTLRE